METKTDKGKGRKLGSHIFMKGNFFGLKLHLDEVVTYHLSPKRKEWKTVGDLRLLVIGHYQMGFEINPGKESSEFRVFIDFEQIRSPLGLFGPLYAKWCVMQMLNGVKGHFKWRQNEN